MTACSLAQSVFSLLCIDIVLHWKERWRATCVVHDEAQDPEDAQACPASPLEGKGHRQQSNSRDNVDDIEHCLSKGRISDTLRKNGDS